MKLKDALLAASVLGSVRSEKNNTASASIDVHTRAMHGYEADVDERSDYSIVARNWMLLW